MSALTEKLGLTVYDDADNPTVKSWRDTINKNAVQSAFSIIDAYAIATDARITTVEQSRKLFRISATEEVANIYVASAPEIESLSNGVQIQVSFDATNTGAATININSTGAKSLKKISLSGVTIDIEPNDIIANKIYTFEYYDNVFIKVGGFSSSEIIMTEGSQDSLLQIGIGGKIQESPVALYNGKISGDGINIGNMLTVENNNIELPTFAETIPGTYLGLTVDAYGRITSTDTPVPNSSGAFVLSSVDGALSWSTKAPDSDKLDGVDSTGYVNTTGTQTIGGAKTFSTLPTLPTTTPSANQAVRKGYADATYLGISAKALDSDKLDGIDSTGYVNTTGTQTIGGAKTFSTLPTLPTTTPSANQAVRKGYADATYLGVSAKAADSEKLDGYDSAVFGRPVFLTTPLTSDSWDGDARSTTAKTKIDLSAVFGVPAGVKAVIVKLVARDSGSATGVPFFEVSPNDTSYSAAVIVSPRGLPNDTIAYNNGVVSCDANGDIYYQIDASGTDTMDVWLEIWGWWL